MVTKNRRTRQMRRCYYSSRLTSKYQVTIPKENLLHLKSGDQITYELLPDNTVIVRKTNLFDLDYLRALELIMNEWELEEDEEFYRNL